MTLRARLAVALGFLTAAAVGAMALVGYRSTSSRLYGEVDRSLVGSASRFADPDGRYASLVCSQLVQEEAPDAGRDQIADLPGTAVQCLDRSGRPFARSSDEALPVGPVDAALAGRGGSPWLHTVEDDRVITVPVRGGGEVQLSR
jgi:hypothetical protein